MGLSKKAKITRLECVTPNWIRVVNAARRTWGKKPMTKEPSDKFKKKILRIIKILKKKLLVLKAQRLLTATAISRSMLICSSPRRADRA